jgi:uncharacterized membrane protein YgdD (TMEM256/DUF423 family)
MTNDPYQPPSAPTEPPTKASGAKYKTYDEVPFFRKQWFFWVSWFIFAPVALVILFSGDVYYRKKGEVVAFGIANKVVGAIFCVLWIFRVYVAVTGSN